MKILKDYSLIILGSFFMGLGIALTKCADLGLSTISSVPNVVSIKYDFLTLGTWSAIWNFVMIAAQILILGRNFKPEQFMQIPVSFVMGWCTDFGVWLFTFIPAEFYFVKLIMTIIGVVVLGFGIALTVVAARVMNPAEAIVKVVADKTKYDFGTMKIVFDVFCVVFAIVMSLIFFNFKIVGIREGTIIAILGTGASIKFFVNCFNKISHKN